MNTNRMYDRVSWLLLLVMCGAFGDAGCITTNDKELAEKFKVFRNYGSRIRYQNEVVGANSRLDELQAGLLRVKLTHLEEFNLERNKIAQRYLSELKNDLLRLPEIRPGADSSWHQFVVHVKDGKRDALMEYLKDKDIGTIIHYPIPPHLSQAYEYLGKKVGDYPLAEQYANEVLSLPMYNGMTSRYSYRRSNDTFINTGDKIKYFWNGNTKFFSCS